MKKIVCVLSAVLLTATLSFAQLTGIKTIPGDYASLALAIADLNLQGVGAGGVTFNVAAGYTETLPSPTAGTITTITGSESRPIKFQKSGTLANPVIKAAILSSVSTTGGIIKIAGTDYVTFDGIDVAENPLNTLNKTNWGFAILVATAKDASQHIHIQNCTITLDKTNTSSRGIYSGTHNATSTTVITPTEPSGTISYCDIDNCQISNVYTGIYFYGYNSPAPYSLYGQNNRFGYTTGNSITNFGGGASIPFAIFTSYQNDLVVAGNIINGGEGTTAGLTGIYISTANNADVNIYNNQVTLTSGMAGNSSLFGIYNSGSNIGTSNTINIYGNIIENCSQPGNGTMNYYMIYNSASALISNIYSNTIRNNTRTAATGSIYLVYLSAASNVGTENVYQNILYGNTVTGTGTSSFFGLYCNNPATRKNVYLNAVYNNSSTAGFIYGIFTSNGTNIKVYKNNVYDQTINSTSGLNYGIKINGGTTTYCYNNLFSDLKAPLTSNTLAIRGISAEGSGDIGLYYNTVFLNGSGSGASFGSASVYAGTNATLDMRNNILVNISVSNGSGKTIAYWRSSTTITSYATKSGNNNLYAGTPGSQNLIFYDGTNAIQTLADYKLFMAPRDAYSFTELPAFLNTASTPYDLHINNSLPSQCESGALTVSEPLSIPTDYDGLTRYPGSGYPNNPAHPASAPDAGAFEFAGIPLDLNPPVITYSPLSNTSLGTGRTLTATITDVNGVPTTGTGLPVCYWKINAGSYQPAVGVWVPGSNEYTFNFGNNVSYGDVISYYIVAQDLASPPHVGANPSAGSNGFTVNPPACSTPPAVPNTYTILNSISGTVTVGNGGTYPSLTGNDGLFSNINSKVLSGDLTVSIISNLTEDGTFALNKIVEELPGNFIITIQPSGATERLIEGNVSNAMIRFSGPQHVTIDGRYNGSGKFLRFRNNNTSSGDFEFSNGSGYNTLRDCIWESGNTSSANSTTGVIRFYTSTGTIGNSNNAIVSNVIRDLTNSSGQPNTSIFTTGSANAPNANNTISGNEVLNFTQYGISSSTNNGDNWVISGNSFYNTMATPLTTAVRAINFITGSGSNGHIISGNYIGGSAPMCGATPWVLNTTGIFYGVYVSAGTLVPTEVYGNAISNIHNINTGSGSFYGIYLSSTGIFHCGGLGGNIIGSKVSPNSIVFDGSDAFRGIYQWGTSAENSIENNIVGNITWQAASGSQQNIYGLSVYAARLANNKIFNLGSTLPGFSPTIYGIYSHGATGSSNEYTNNIVDIDGGVSANPTIYGFFEISTGTSVSSLFFNTFYIHGNATATSSTYAWRRDGGATNFLKDNIFFNDRAAGGTGSHYALYDTVTMGILQSDYNDITSPNGILGHRGTLDILTLTDWQAATSGDIHSVSTNPDFVSATDLHPTNPGLDNTGIAIAGIIKDFNGFTRGNPPDMGALEFPSIPETIIVTGTIGSTLDTCYNALNTITVAGGGTPFDIQAGGNVTMIAGQKIIYLQGTSVASGGYLHGYITNDGQFCNSQQPTNPVATGTAEQSQNSNGSLYTVYPNPTSGNFTIIVKEGNQTGKLNVELYNMQGKKVLSEAMTGEKKHEFNISEKPAGLYFIRIVSAIDAETVKLVKTR